MLLPITKTEIAKEAVRLVVYGHATAFAEDQLIERTELDPDGITVKVGSSVIGMFVAAKAKPYTDKLVDTAVTRYQTWRSKKNVDSNITEGL